MADSLVLDRTDLRLLALLQQQGRAPTPTSPPR